LAPALRLRAAVWFHGPIVAAIHAFKYNGIAAAAGPLSGLMASAWGQWGLAADVIVPVALHPTRERERGYNQATLLARQLSRQLELPLAEAGLERTRITRPQVGLSAGERLRNVSGAFRADADLVAGKAVLLVDDVCTTGATINAAAEALLASGASAVSAYCIARADSG
jgi:ComF family protein